MNAHAILRTRGARHIAVVVGLTTVVLAAGAGVHYLNADAEESAQGSVVASEAASQEETESATAADKEVKDVSKEETVHVSLDATGNVTGVKSINILKNSGGQASVADKSSLSGIETSDEDASFTASGEEITWTPGEDDITYSGTSDATPPLSVKISYKLDGEEISAEELAGKSGKVKITYRFTNESSIPFVAASVLELDTDIFTHIEVDNGTVLEGTDSSTVIGLAFPGLQNMLDLDADTFELPESFTVTAQASGFALDTANTLVTSSLFEDIDTSDFETGDLDDLEDGLDELESAMDDATSGAYSLESGAGQLASGLDQLESGSKAMESGVGTAASGLKTATKTSKQAAKALEALLNSSSLSAQEKAAASQYLAAIKGANSAVSATAKAMDGNSDSLASKLKTFTASIQQLSSGASQLQSGAASLASGLQQLNDEGISELKESLTGSDSALIQLKDMPDTLEGLSKKADAFESFSGKADGMEGSVLFIYQAAAIG